jgi:hypothetical protein
MGNAVSSGRILGVIRIVQNLLTAMLVIQFMACDADASSIADQSAPANCFSKAENLSLQAISKSPMALSSKIEVVTNQCHELQPSGEYATIYKSPSMVDSIRKSEPVRFIHGIIFGKWSGAFSSLKGSPAQNEFMAKMNDIRQIQNPMERIRLVYDLVRATQGAYDNESNGFRTILRGGVVLANRPGNLIDAANENGTIGVCRENAALLSWALLQVSRHPSSKGMALNPDTDFSAEQVNGVIEGMGHHAWVRVNLPKRDPNGQVKFQSFDLDTTFYREFTPLEPRLSGLEPQIRQRYFDQCQTTMVCLLKQTAVDLNSDASSQQKSNSPLPANAVK